MKTNDYDEIYNWESYILQSADIIRGSIEHYIDNYTSYFTKTDDIKLRLNIYVPGEKDDYRFHEINIISAYKVDADNGKLIYKKEEKPKIITTLLQSDDFNCISEDFFSFNFSETNFENICNDELPKLIIKDLETFIADSDMFVKADKNAVNHNSNTIKLIANSLSEDLISILYGLRKGDLTNIKDTMNIYQEELRAAKVEIHELEYLHNSIIKADKIYLYNNLENNLNINPSIIKRPKI